MAEKNLNPKDFSFTNNSRRARGGSINFSNENKAMKMNNDRNQRRSGSIILNESNFSHPAPRNVSTPCAPTFYSNLNEIKTWTFQIKFHPNAKILATINEKHFEKWLTGIVDLKPDSLNISIVSEKNQEFNYQIFLSTNFEITDVYFDEKIDLAELSETCLTQYIPKILDSNNNAKNIESNTLPLQFIFFRSRNYNILRGFSEYANEAIKFSNNFNHEIVVLKIPPTIEQRMAFGISELSEFYISSTGRIQYQSTSLNVNFTNLGVSEIKPTDNIIARSEFEICETFINKSDIQNKAGFLIFLSEIIKHDICKQITENNQKHTYAFDVPKFYGQINLIKFKSEFYKQFPIKVRGMIEMFSENSLEITVDVHPYKIHDFLPLGEILLRIQFPDSWSVLFKNNKSKDQNKYIELKANQSGGTLKTEKSSFNISNGFAFYQKGTSSLVWKLDWLYNLPKVSKTVQIESLKCNINVPFEIKKPDNFQPYIEVESKTISTPAPIIKIKNLKLFNDYAEIPENVVKNVDIRYHKKFRLRYYMALKEDGELKETFGTG